jgi:UDP-N-acetylmuramate--alanine ligase
VNLEKVNMVYCLGIGGIGVSALARYFAQKSCKVAGYDKTPTLLTSNLESEDISVTFTDDEKHFNEIFGNAATENILIIYTPAIPKESKLFNYFIANGFIVKKRSEVLEYITAEKFTIAVAGTHGKTTTTTILAHIFKSAGIPITAFMGGISTNYNTNFISENNTKLIVIEADEYDRSFLRLKPDIAIVTSADPDHLDIYDGENDLENTFIQFTERVKKGGKLVIQNKAKQKLGKNGSDILSYDATTIADFYIDQLSLENGVYKFSIIHQGVKSEGFEFHLPGKHNLENALAAASAALLYGLSIHQIKDAFKTYSGVKRRFEYQVKNENKVYIDDYAHHPDEVKACLRAVKDFYPNKKMLVVFQPHLFSRTKDFYEGFAKELSIADILILLPIYPARELPMQGVSSKMIFDLAHNAQKLLIEKADLINTINQLEFDVIVSMGAGDIDTEIEKIKNLVEEKIIAHNLN